MHGELTLFLSSYIAFPLCKTIRTSFIQELYVSPRAGLNQLRTAEIGPVEQPYNELWENFDIAHTLQDFYGRNVLTHTQCNGQKVRLASSSMIQHFN